MDYSRTARSADGCDVGIARKKPVNQSAVGPSGAGMHRKIGRLIDGDDAPVLVDDFKLNTLWSRSCGPVLAEPDRDLICRFQAAGRFLPGRR